ncbi:MAG: MtnX-like HAD-IB family phosphatase [Desulfovibrio sp.]|jgi:2,3-diketo-5-methylthio-1-phosphopentane phosphatase|nr:MtnX-like HAD-IB family phosphatase [Desulfovibrio sp.]
MRVPAANPFPDLAPEKWSIICDFDGTITPFDVTDAVLEAFAAPLWKEIEKQWDCGDISARQCMERQIGLLDVAPEDLDAFLDGIPLTEGFREFVRFCRSRSLDIRVVSDGMDYAIRRVLARHGLDSLPVLANRLLRAGPSGYRLEFPHSAAGCPSGMCKCAVARTPGKRILLIGDGASDCCLAREAAFVLSRRGLRLERHCRENRYPCLPYENFFDILHLFKAPGPPS